MRIKLLLAGAGMFLLLKPTTPLHADQLEMQNGDRYVGKVLSLSDDSVTFQSGVLGKIKVPRTKVASLAFGEAVPDKKPTTNVVQTNPPPANPVAAKPAVPGTNVDLSAALRSLSGNSNLVQQIREQMLATSPEANKKYNEMINGLMTGRVNLNDIRREAKSSADQLRAYKRELGPEADDALDMY
ncbi:MAG: hypothetical protein ACTHLW_02050, partial [Verrucomicrobiota bacterium]